MKCKLEQFVSIKSCDPGRITPAAGRSFYQENRYKHASDHRGDNRAGRLYPVIKHIVMFKFKRFAESNDKLGNTHLLKSYLEALPAKINEIKFLQVGVNFSEATVAYDLVLISEFFSKEALSSYQQHPEHIKVADFVGKVCESRVVVDYVF